MKKGLTAFLVVCALLGLVGMAGASLVTIGTAKYDADGSGTIDENEKFNLIYENDYDNNGHGLVWLDYSHTPGSWATQKAWAANLDLSSSVTLLPGYSTAINWTDWRLPNATAVSGYNQTGAEMGHLFYTELGNSGNSSGGALVHTGDFQNLSPKFYWSNKANNVATAWAFDFNRGLQAYANNAGLYPVLAVHEGTVVPIPGALWLLGSGLLGLVAVRRRKKS